MTIKTKKEKAKVVLEEYFQIRKEIFNIFAQTHDSSLAKGLNANKQAKVNEFDRLLSDREHNLIIPEFQEIVSGKIKGCDSKQMSTYLTSSAQEQYYQCLDKQKEAVFELIDDAIKPSVTIIDAGDSIFFHANN